MWEKQEWNSTSNEGYSRVVYELPVRTYLLTDDSVMSILIVLEKSILLPSMSTLLQQQNIWGFEAGKKWNVSRYHIAYKAVSWRKVCCDVLADSTDFEYG